MNELKNTIFKRKSSRNYNDEAITDEEINNLKKFIANAKSLDSSIKTDYDILTNSEVSTRMSWKAPMYIAIYSEDAPNYKVNAGFIYQQVDLYLQSNGLGSCWIGMGKPKNPRKDLKFVILIGFGKSDQSIHREFNEFKRNPIEKITDYPNDDLECARLAPSAINSQPWYFKKNDEGYEVYSIKHNFIKARILGKLNPIDMGIVLAHLYISNPNTFKFEFDENCSELKGYTPLGKLSF
ncbi:MAG: nitroreductase family protein [Methanobacteriaceae archaeon]|nr:nitroreductase family protein [Methanobacteriaceae archaeon]